MLRPPGHHPNAFDFVKMDGKRKSYHNVSKFWFYLYRIPASRFYCWNKPVYAPISGKVIQVGNGWQDNKYTNIWKTIQLWYNATYRFRPKEKDGRLDIRPNAGNYVMIQAKEGYIVLLAHLRNESVLVSDGAIVRQGDLIGMVGNSGNATMPHLHINLFDQMDNPFKAKVLPFVFTHYEALADNERWIENKLSIPMAGTFVRFNASNLHENVSQYEEGG